MEFLGYLLAVFIICYTHVCSNMTIGYFLYAITFLDKKHASRLCHK